MWHLVILGDRVAWRKDNGEYVARGPLLGMVQPKDALNRTREEREAHTWTTRAAALGWARRVNIPFKGNGE